MALFARGGAAFRQLVVQGLELYTFPVLPSRYRLFGDHVRSWSGDVHTLVPDMLGPGSTTSMVAELWSGTQAEVTDAMCPSAEAAGRDVLLARWAAALGLALRDDVDRLELSRVEEGGQTTALLLETPEP